MALLILLLIGAALIAFFTWLYWEKKSQRITAFVVGVIVAGVFCWWVWATTFSNEHVAVCQVTGKDRGANDSSLVYTEDCGTLESRNIWYRGKTNSADVWSRIPDEGLVEFRIVGINFGLFRTFPIILDAQPIG